jgi:hypothetical protein
MTHNLRMNGGDYSYLWHRSAWPVWRSDVPVLSQPLGDLSCAQSLLIEPLADVGMALRNQARLTTLSADVIKTSVIEDE